MILVPVKEEFDQLLLSVSGVVALLEGHRFSFIDEVRVFISTIEKAAEKYHLPFASEMEILRGKLYVIDELGDFQQRGGGGYNPETRRVYRRNREAFALKRLDEACQLTRNYFAAADASFSESQTLCRQMASIARTKGLIPELTSEGRDTQLRTVVSQFTKDQDLCSLSTHVIGLIGIHNTVILFDRALMEVDL
jgi:hypothetical protein